MVAAGGGRHEKGGPIGGTKDGVNGVTCGAREGHVGAFRTVVGDTAVGAEASGAGRTEVACGGGEKGGSSRDGGKRRELDADRRPHQRCMGRSVRRRR